jgi:prolyl-tRNA synthetase
VRPVRDGEGERCVLARMSRLFVPTLRESPSDAEIASHRLLIRAGFIRRVGDAAGIYALLPLGWASVARIEAIIREEMDAIGGQELRLPIVQPAELWQQTGRWAVYGEEMWRLTDRHGRQYCLGPTHEEVVTDLVRLSVRSWRQLPLLLYQIQNKYRDERRPRFGLLRAREFIMKDGYSFHRDEADLERCYREVFDAYARIFARLGLTCRAVRADAGAIGGHLTHEFMALADSGEAELLFCPVCDWAADVEEAEVVAPPAPTSAEAPPPCRVPTPGCRTVPEVAAYLGVPEAAVAKILFFWAETSAGARRAVAALVPGDREVNEVKLRHATDALRLAPMDAAEAPAPVGYAGPIGLRGVDLFTDPLVLAGPPGGGGWVVGANEPDLHLAGVVPGRDFDPGTVAPLVAARPGDPCPACGAPLVGRRGIEVGQVFGLGTKYSTALGARYLDVDGQERPIVMGCYGIGVTRTLAAIVEQHHDDAGIVWPPAVAPYDCVLLPLGGGAEGTRALEVAERLGDALQAEGVRVVLDDRDERPGVKFKDADLVGFPERVTLGRSLDQGLAEWKGRAEGEARLVPVEELPRRLAERVRAAGGGGWPAGRRPA